MDSGKTDNSFTMALNLPEEVREETADLNIGYENATKSWEIIVKYHGEIQRLGEMYGAKIETLYGGFAIVTIRENLLEAFLSQEEIEYAEKPNRMFFELETNRAEVCLPAYATRIGGNRLTGKGVIVGIIDSGIDVRHPDFCNADGTSRIRLLWDQTAENGVYTEEEINRVLGVSVEGNIEIRGEENRTDEYEEEDNSRIERLRNQLFFFDLSGHGTAVSGIAAGNSRASGGKYSGVAPECDLMVVKLGNSVGNSFPRTTNLMRAVDFLVRAALERRQPIAINISFGNNYGAHNGESILERYLDAVVGVWKTAIIVGMGNEGNARGHYGGRLSKDSEEIELIVAKAERTLSVQIWKNYADEFMVELESPSGKRTEVKTGRMDYVRTIVYGRIGEPKPYSSKQEIYLEFVRAAESEFLESGSWKIRLIPEKVVSGEYDMWLPVSETLNPLTGFSRASEGQTFTIPASAAGVISVGAYRTDTESYAPFSGRGFSVGSRNSKPDLAAPGVDIFTTAPGGGYTYQSGTSMSAPFVTGAAALLMQWGIVEERDPYLYGEKIKAYLQKGARNLPGILNYPNELVGWGTLCVQGSLPRNGL